MTVGDKVNGVLVQVVIVAGKEMDGFGLTLTFTMLLLWQPFVLVTVTEKLPDVTGLTVMAEDIAPVPHLKVWEEALNFVSSVMEFDWQTSTEVGRLITGFGTIAMEAEAFPVQPDASETVTA